MSLPTPALDLSPDHRTLVTEILRRHIPDREVWAFGSRVHGRAKPYSDLDLAVIGDTPLSLATSLELREELSESNLPFKVDLVDWATTSETFREVIRAQKVVIQIGV
jgi:type I restriction enzyme S subunit